MNFEEHNPQTLTEHSNSAISSDLINCIVDYERTVGEEFHVTEIACENIEI